MDHSGKFSKVFSLVIVLILALAANDVFVIAQDGGNDDASTPEQEFLGSVNERAVTYGRVSVNPAAFQPDSSGWTFSRTNYTELNANWIAFFYAPLTIPDGVTVTRLVLGYYDTSPDNLIWIRLFRQEIWGGEVEEMAYAQSVTNSGYYFRMDETINHALIDLTNYTYFISVKFNYYDGSTAVDSVRLVGVRVDYQNPTTTYLPIIQD